MKSKIQSYLSKNLFYISIALLLFILIPRNTEAYTITKLNIDNNEDFVVEPGKTEIFLNPGETVTKNISVTNRTNRTLDFNVGVENLIGSNDANNSVVLIPSGQNTPYPLDEYVDFEIDHFTLQFGERITFAITVNVPANIEPGGHYGAVVISNKSSGNIGESGDTVKGGAQLTSRIGSLILMRINGDVNESGKLESFKISSIGQWFHQKMPTSFEVVFKNDGSVHLVPYGKIVIKNIFGSDITQIPIDAYFALPDSRRYQTITWPGKSFSLGLYTAEIELYKGYGRKV